MKFKLGQVWEIQPNGHQLKVTGLANGQIELTCVKNAHYRPEIISWCTDARKGLRSSWLNLWNPTTSDAYSYTWVLTRAYDWQEFYEKIKKS